MIYSCNEHVNEAIEEALTDEGLPPILEVVSFDVKQSEKCFLCHGQAVYKVNEQN